MSSGFIASNRSNYLLERCSNCSWRCLVSGFKNTLKIAEIEGVFYYISTMSGDMADWRPAFDSPRQIGLSTSSKGKLMVVGECVKGVFEKSERSKRFCYILCRPERPVVISI